MEDFTDFRDFLMGTLGYSKSDAEELAYCAVRDQQIPDEVFEDGIEEYLQTIHG